MKIRLLNISLIIFGAVSAMATEEPEYKVVRQDENIEIREYEPHIIAETQADGSLTEAASNAFQKLFKFISGANSSQQKIPMTSPVSQKAKGEKIPMTAPVSQHGKDGDYLVSFTMPSSFTIETTPVPTDKSVSIRAIPARRVAAIRYSGRWTARNYQDNLKKLEKWIKDQGLIQDGPAVWARYNPPFTLPLFRRNEVIIPLKK